jgi:hypothetical protein
VSEQVSFPVWPGIRALGSPPLARELPLGLLLFQHLICHDRLLDHAELYAVEDKLVKVLAGPPDEMPDERTALLLNPAWYVTRR